MLRVPKVLAISAGLILTVSAVARADVVWEELDPTGSPPATRGFHGTTAVYDPGSNRMIAFAGMSSSFGLPYNDVWVLTDANGVGGNSSWIQLKGNDAAGSPRRRAGHTAVYDEANNRMIIYGGCRGGCAGPLPDVWVLENANGLGGPATWTQLAPGSGPIARVGHAAAYDPGSNRMIVFGGFKEGGGGSPFLSDVWVLSHANGLGGTPDWIQLSVSGGPPEGSYGVTGSYDPASNRLIVFGGANSVWVLTHANGLGGDPTWINLIPRDAPGSPPPRAFHSAVYDATRNQMTVFGGAHWVADVWVLEHANGLGGTPSWRELAPTGDLPGPRCCHDAVLDPSTQRMTVFAGSQGSHEVLFNDAWVLQLDAPTEPDPAPCEGAVGQWSLDEGSGPIAVDDSGFGNDGTVDGAALWTDGQVGGALAFDGIDDSISIADPGAGWALDLGSNLTVSTWVYLSSVAEHQMLVSKDEAYELEVGLDGPGVYTLRLNNIRVGRGESILEPFTWHLLTATWDGNTVRYYLDGEPDGTTPFVGSLAQNDNTLGLGARYHAFPQSCDRFLHRGLLDEVCLFDRTLGDGEVQTLFEASNPDVEPPRRLDLAPARILLPGPPTTLSVRTDEFAVCRYDTVAGTPFESMGGVFGTSDGSTHTAALGSLTDETIYRFFVRCQDLVGNTNLDDREIVFAVSSTTNISLGIQLDLPMEEAGCMAFDASGHGADATLGPDCDSNSPTWEPTGGERTSLLFDGQDDQVTVDAPLLSTGWTEITMVAWIRHPPTGLFRSILDRRLAGNDGFDLYLSSDSKLFARINDATATSSAIVADDRWHHVAAVYDGATLSFYVDSRLDSSLAIGSTLLAADSDLFLGRNWSNLNHTFAGQLGEVRLYDRALSEIDILHLYLNAVGRY